jgi:hypothetical protein
LAVSGSPKGVDRESVSPAGQLGAALGTLKYLQNETKIWLEVTML